MPAATMAIWGEPLKVGSCGGTRLEWNDESLNTHTDQSVSGRLFENDWHNKCLVE